MKRLPNLGVDIYHSKNSKMGSSEIFALKWDDHLQNMSHTFRELREDNSLSDVTLVCDDYEVDAHRIVLSSSSNFFQKMFSRRRNNKYSPLVYLRGVKKDLLLSVLDFVYLGEVNIEQQRLQSFLEFAEDLEIKGVSPQDRKNSHQNRKDFYAPPSNVSSQLLESHSMSSNLLQSSDLLSCPSYEEINKMSRDQQSPDLKVGGRVQPSSSSIGSHEYQVIGDPEMAAVTPLSDSLMHFENGFWICRKCGKREKNKHNLRDHTETHSSIASYHCSHCGKYYKTRNSLRVHKYKVHGGEKLIQQLSYVI